MNLDPAASFLVPYCPASIRGLDSENRSSSAAPREVIALRNRRYCENGKAQAWRLPRQHQPRRLRKRTRSPSPARGRFSCDDDCSGRGRQRGRRARLGLWRPGLRQREVSGVQHDDFPNAFLPPFVRSATIP
jgi:hypothetical protein